VVSTRCRSVCGDDERGIAYCGVFHQRVLHFSSNPLLRLISQLGTAIYVGAIVHTLILAKPQMIDLIWFILRNFQKMLIGPWRTEVLPP
jgi:hypothetical protein